MSNHETEQTNKQPAGVATTFFCRVGREAPATPTGLLIEAIIHKLWFDRASRPAIIDLTVCLAGIRLYTRAPLTPKQYEAIHDACAAFDKGGEPMTDDWPADRLLAELEKAWRWRYSDMGIALHYVGPERGAVHEMFQRMTANESALMAERGELGRFIVDNFAEGKVDAAATLKLAPGMDPKPDETVTKMAIDRLKLAIERGAFAP